MSNTNIIIRIVLICEHDIQLIGDYNMKRCEPEFSTHIL